MVHAKSDYRRMKDDYKELIKQENEKFENANRSMAKRSKGRSETTTDRAPGIDYRAILKEKSTITKRDWGGHCFEYYDKEIASSYKVDDLTQEQAKMICGILKIPLTEEGANQIPKENLCPCGCGEMLRKGAKFRPGHDTRLRCRLIKEYKRTRSSSVLRELRKWGWEKFLG